MKMQGVIEFHHSQRGRVRFAAHLALLDDCVALITPSGVEIDLIPWSEVRDLSGWALPLQPSHDPLTESESTMNASTPIAETSGALSSRRLS